MIRLFKVGMDPSAAPAVSETLNSGYIGQGAKVDAFEEALAKELDHPVDGVITTNSCTSAIDLALHLCEVGPGSEVLSTPVSCTASNTMVMNRHARIVWCDVDPHTGCIDPEDVSRKVTRLTKAIIAVDWAGRQCNYQKLNLLGKPIIQDAAHRLSHNKLNRYACFSFQAIKYLTTGDGGALLLNNEEGRARLLRWYGLDRRGPSESFRCAQTIREAGYKYHMNDIAATIGLSNLALARRNVLAQQANAKWMSDALRALDPAISLPPWDDDCSWWLYTILVPDQQKFINKMLVAGVEASPVHARNDKHPAFRGYGGPLPGVDYFAGHEVAIPIGWWLTESDKIKVAETVLECV